MSGQPARTGLVYFLGYARMAVGIATLVAPSVAAPFFGVPGAAANVDAAFIARLFGIRDLMLGYVVAQTPADIPLRRALQVGVICDSADVISGIVAASQGLQPLGIALGPCGAGVLAGLSPQGGGGKRKNRGGGGGGDGGKK